MDIVFKNMFIGKFGDESCYCNDVSVMQDNKTEKTHLTLQLLTHRIRSV